jgi:hypothetical protein
LVRHVGRNVDEVPGSGLVGKFQMIAPTETSLSTDDLDTPSDEEFRRQKLVAERHLRPIKTLGSVFIGPGLPAVGKQSSWKAPSAIFLASLYALIWNNLALASVAP